MQGFNFVGSVGFYKNIIIYLYTVRILVFYWSCHNEKVLGAQKKAVTDEIVSCLKCHLQYFDNCALTEQLNYVSLVINNLLDKTLDHFFLKNKEV